VHLRKVGTDWRKRVAVAALVTGRVARPDQVAKPREVLFAER
jgi:hypothetical protein